MPSESVPANTAEVRLALLLCRYPAPAIDNAGLQTELSVLCSQKVDWASFLRLVEYHRIVSLVSKNVSALDAPLPAFVNEQLRVRSARNVVECFRYLAEVQRLLQVLNEAGIHARVIKGVALSLQAYGDISTRDVGDIDLLIPEYCVEKADRVLVRSDDAAKSLLRKDPGGLLTPRRLSAYIASFKDFTYQPASTAIAATRNQFEVDLHWRLFRNPFMPGNCLTEEPYTRVSAGSIQLPTFSRQVNLLYLSVHGALDGWTRLKAVADVAALWNGMSDLEQEAALELSRETGVFPYLQSALILAAQWIGGIAVPDTEVAERSSVIAAAVVSAARKNMEGNRFLPPLREASSWKMKRYEASLSSSREYRRAIVRRVLYRPRVWTRFDLPDRWFNLYPLLSPLEWLLFRVDRWRGRS